MPRKSKSFPKVEVPNIPTPEEARQEALSETLPRLHSHSIMLGQIAAEVEEFCEHPDCTTLQAVQLMKCKLKEYEIRDIRNQIYKTWKD